MINSLFVLPVDLRTLGLTSDCERVMNEFRLTVDQYDKQMIHDNPEIQKKNINKNDKINNSISYSEDRVSGVFSCLVHQAA